jgi:glucosamine--fructose-6-phosphate aminotransferase (isomerizing)
LIAERHTVSPESERAFPHRMLAEIYEQPEALRETVRRSVEGGRIFPGPLGAIEPALANCGRLIIAASGSSRNAGLAGEVQIEDLSGLAVDVEYASEYAYRSAETSPGTLVMVISQSGESADAIAALREAQKRGAPTLGVTNAPESTVAREASAALLTRATPEVAVPATKSFTTQLAMLFLFALRMAGERGRMDAGATARHLDSLGALPGELEKRLNTWSAAALEAARRFTHSRAFLCIGRGVHYAIAREGALKLKEISYCHAEGYPAGELLHGPNALVGERSVVVGLATRDERDRGSVSRYERTLAVLEYVKAHRGHALVIASEGDVRAQSLGDCSLSVPAAPELLLPLVEVVPLQLFAYHLGVLHGCNVDHPRNLVKAVTT